MAQPRLSKAEKQWQAENDARTLAEADVIRNDSIRRKLAIKEAKKMAKEAIEKAEAMKKVARGNSPTKPVRKKKK